MIIILIVIEPTLLNCSRHMIIGIWQDLNTLFKVKQHKTIQTLTLYYREWRTSYLQFLRFASFFFQEPPYDCPYIFPSFDLQVSTSFRNLVWTVEIRRMTWLYVQNINTTFQIHHMRHTILWDYLLENIVITSQLAMMYQFQKYAKDARML